MSFIHSSITYLSCLLLCVLAGSVLASNNYQTAPSVSIKSGVPKIIHQRLDAAQSWAQLEQEVEDYNAHLVASAPDATSALTKRRLICLPLDERFNPPMGVFSHNHVQTGDKMSLPRCFWQAIQGTHAEVPWLFEVSRVEGVSRERVANVSSEHASQKLDKAVGGPLDFRAPSNYCFLPWWMMRALGLHPRDVVDVRLITTVPPGSAAKLQPHSSKFAKEIANPQAVLETELKHYSALTRGATIAFDYNNERYWFDVVDLRSAPRGEKVPLAKVQDCDIATEFLPAKDSLKKKKQEKQ